MENRPLVETTIECDICIHRLYLLTISGDDAYHWCPYCGSTYMGGVDDPALYVRMPGILSEVEW